MEVILGFLLSVWTGLGLPVVDTGSDPEPTEESSCIPEPEDRIVLKDLSRPNADGAYYLANGCHSDGASA